jgi:hypothetical protein
MEEGMGYSLVRLRERKGGKRKVRKEVGKESHSVVSIYFLLNN